MFWTKIKILACRSFSDRYELSTRSELDYINQLQKKEEICAVKY